MLFDEARAVKAAVSMATIYNTLHQFTRAGLLREIVVEGSRAFYDTNTSPHGHSGGRSEAHPAAKGA
jgi:Fur family iron response transcriptional regulator